MRVKRIDHVAVAVEGLERGLEFWAQALGLEPAELHTVESEGVKVAMLPVGESNVELLEPLSADTTVGRFLAKRGPGIHHVTFEVEDLDEALCHLRAGGIELLGDAPRAGAGGTRVAFVHPKHAGGVLVELVEGREQERRTDTIEPGRIVLLYLREPQEKFWGMLRRLDGAGAVIEGIDLGSFDDWVAQIERGEDSVVGPSVLFLPMARVEKVLLDRPSGNLPSLAERFERRTGRSVSSILDPS